MIYQDASHLGMVGHLFYFGVPPIDVSKAEPATSHIIRKGRFTTRLPPLGVRPPVLVPRAACCVSLVPGSCDRNVSKKSV